MYRSAHRHFALNVDKLAAPEPYLRRNPRRLAERIARKVIDDQTVNLPDPFALDVQKDCPLVNLLQHRAVDAVGTVNLRLYRLIDVVLTDLARLGLACPVIRLFQQIADRRNVCRQFFGIVGQPRRIFYDPCHRLFVQRPQVFLFRQRTDELGVFYFILVRAVDNHAEVGLNLKVVAEIGVALAQQVIQLRITGHNHLDVQRYRLRIKRNRRKARIFARRLNLNFLGSQRPFQRIPRIRLQQQFPRVNKQKAAVGTVQCSALNQGKVGNQRAELLNTLNLADQVPLRRMIQKHNRRPAVRHVLNHDIDLKLAVFVLFLLVFQLAQQPCHRLFFGLRLAVLVIVRHKARNIFQNIVLHRFQILGDFLVAAVFLLYVVNRLLNRILNQLFL